MGSGRVEPYRRAKESINKNTRYIIVTMLWKYAMFTSLQTVLGGVGLGRAVQEGKGEY